MHSSTVNETCLHGKPKHFVVVVNPGRIRTAEAATPVRASAAATLIVPLPLDDP